MLSQSLVTFALLYVSFLEQTFHMYSNQYHWLRFSIDYALIII